MSFPIWESRPCKDRSQYYIIDKKVYVCHTHKATKYSSDDFIQLIPPDSIRLILKVVDQCRMKLLVSPSTQGYHASEIEYNILDTTITEAINQILSRLGTAVECAQFFKLEALFQEAKQLEDFIMNDQLFIKYSTTKSWKKALAVVEGTAEKSAALVTKELREKYDSLIKRTVGEFKKQRDRILEEKSRLEIKLSEEKTRFDNLKEELKHQEESFKQDLKTQKEEYEKKIEGLLSIQPQLEQTKSTLIDEAKEREQEIYKLNKDFKNKSEDMKESEQKFELSNEKSKERRERIEVWKSRLAKEKEAFEASKAQLQQLWNDYDLQLKESSEKRGKDLQDQLAVFNNEYKKKNDAIHKLEKEASKLTEVLNQERKDHQALMVAHTNLQKEKQNIAKKQAEDFSELEQYSDALEEESNAKDIDIMKFEEEKKELEEKLKNAREHNELIKQHFAPSVQTYSIDDDDFIFWVSYVRDEYGNYIQVYRENFLTLDPKEDYHLAFLRGINKRIPDIYGISIKSALEENEDIKTFLYLYFPNEVCWFNFNKYSGLKACLSFYMDELKALSPKVKEGMTIYNFEVNQHQMKTLLIANKRKRCFGFYDCKLDLSSVPDFGGALQGSKLKKLFLDSWGSNARGIWKKNPPHFENLIEGLAKEQDFKKNLKEIRLSRWGMEKSQVEETLKKYEFGEVQILM